MVGFSREPEYVDHRETYLVVHERESKEVVTVLEALSPESKVAEKGRQEYLGRREEIVASGKNLVELDLLRGGPRPPTVPPLPPGDFYALVTRGGKQPKTEVLAWTLRSRLPTVPVPLSDGDPDVHFDLQSIFEQIYDRAGYDLSLNYTEELSPPLSESDRSWVRSEVFGQTST